MNFWSWFFFFLFLLTDIFFAVLRAALVNVRVPQLIEQGTDNPHGLEDTIAFLERPRLRAALRLIMAFSHLLLAACVWNLVDLYLPTKNLAQMIGVFSLLLFFLLSVEFLLERLPLKDPEKWTLVLTPIAKFFDTLLSPITKYLIFLQGTSHTIPRALGSVTEDELLTWVEVGQPEGGLEPDERKMIYSIFQFGDTLCREIMVPRMEVLALEVKTPLRDAINAFVQSGHSRVPVYDDSIDNVVGILYAKDLLKIQGNSTERISIKKFIRPAYFVPESKKVDELLAEMQAKGFHIAIVVDEYGGMAGLVTLEDIVEEIVGEIRDEYDQSEELLVQKIDADHFIFKGRVSIDDFNDALDTEMETDQNDTLGGYFYNELGRVPVEGDQLEVQGWQITVEEVRGRRVGRIRARRIKPSTME